jgi:hypothetical protein
MIYEIYQQGRKSPYLLVDSEEEAISTVNLLGANYGYGEYTKTAWQILVFERDQDTGFTSEYTVSSLFYSKALADDYAKVRKFYSYHIQPYQGDKINEEK